MAEKPPATYEELAAQRAEEWVAAQAQLAAQLKTLHLAIAAMPDVAGAPPPNTDWSHPDIACPCGHTTFLVTRYVTCNGIKTRCELVCTACKTCATWDWGRAAWLPVE